VRILTLNRLLALAAAGVLAFALLVMSPLGASADVSGSNYSSRVYADGVHLVGDSSAFPNFEGPNTKGAVDNHYPMARVTQDASPSSHAVASYADVGPLGQTIVACSNPDPTQCPPIPGAPYANADYPGGNPSDHVDSCTPAAAATKQPNPCPKTGQPAAYGDDSASELAAAASSFFAGGGTLPFAGAFSETTSTVGSDGSLTVHAHSAVANATFGPFVIQKLDVVVDVVTAGGQVSKQTVTVTVGSVTLNGQPVSVTDQGVTATQSVPIPCPSSVPSTSPLQLSPTTCTPQVTTDTFKLATVTPTKTVSGSHATIDAVGLDVWVTHPPVPGAPQQTAEYILGEAYVDAFNDPSASSGDLGGFGSFGTDFGFGGADFGSGGAPAVNSGASHLRTMLVANRQPLALLFLFWETLVLGAAASWVWARRKPVLAELGLDQ
jgi:hypothetical protein